MSSFASSQNSGKDQDRVGVLRILECSAYLSVVAVKVIAKHVDSEVSLLRSSEAEERRTCLVSL
jgi:hypothetical protein